MTNFDFLKTEVKFESFADVAISAEKILPIDVAASIINCRRAMEFAVKWMYSVDSSLVMPWDDKLVSLMNTEEFRDVVDDSLWVRMDFIRKKGNTAAHSGRRVTKSSQKVPGASATIARRQSTLRSAFSWPTNLVQLLERPLRVRTSELRLPWASSRYTETLPI